MFQITHKVFEDESALNDALNALRNDHTCSRLGYGSYGTVFSDDNDADRVIKITHGQDKAYFAYLKLIYDLGFENPYVPQVYSVEAWHIKGTEYTVLPELSHARLVVRMERLRESFDGWDYSRRATSNVLRMLKHYAEPSWDEEKDAYGSNFVGDINNLNKEHQDIVCLLRMLKEIYPKIGYDLRTANMMRRGHQVVITDPVAYLD
jgi:hypothetical protein